MNISRFVARDAADAANQVRSGLGKEAVVLSVKSLPATGLGRFLRKRRLEVLACLPERKENPPLGHAPESAAVSEFAARVIPATGQHLNQLDSETTDLLRPESTQAESDAMAPNGCWRSAAILQQMGLQSLHVEKILERAQSQFGDLPPASLAKELELVKSVLASFWRPAEEVITATPTLHVFVGPPGSGKTTVLCKWLAKSVLAEGNKARAWRLDGRGPNFAGLLDMYGEILNVPVERGWNQRQSLVGVDVGFVDLPGIDPQDQSSVHDLDSRIRALPNAQVHLVLNAAYDLAVALAQARAFRLLPVSDVIFTHVDEEKRRVKLWNFILGTNFTVRFLSGGQNIPGEFLVPALELLVLR